MPKEVNLPPAQVAALVGNTVTTATITLFDERGVAIYVSNYQINPPIRLGRGMTFTVNASFTVEP